MLSKTKTIYNCFNCGAKFPKWMGQCSQCNEWNTIKEKIVRKEKPNEPIFKENIVRDISTIETCEKERIIFNDSEFNRVLGGGLVRGSVILISGEPGIGKSTILLQNSINSNEKVLYISGEESAEQLNLRSKRISNSPKNCFVLTETNIETILKNVEKTKPEIIVIDSIQTVQTDLFDNSQGSTTQIKECTSILIKLAKNIGIPILIVGHITKDGNIAGPKILEHMVDVVLHFEGDKQHQFRILRSKKNRFGSTNEIGIYQMNEKGLQIVLNPSELFISKKDTLESGTAIAVTLDGDRSIMIEVQALVSSAVYGTPQRISNGFNSKRLNMLLAILEKKAGFKIGVKDVFINITGGIKIDDTAIDLAVVSAILSSNINISINSDTCFCAEIDLSGELRGVSNVDRRISESERLGYNKIIVSNNSKIGYNVKRIEVLKLKNLDQVVKQIFKERG
jgi:DNA repair protein RadA/Sms|tara:strand:+ start:10649 stop:12004 length:1356 start_codon:yes stop_codon:yes gene_type:complete